MQALHLWLQAMGMKHALPASAVPTMVRASLAPGTLWRIMFAADSTKHELQGHCREPARCVLAADGSGAHSSFQRCIPPTCDAWTQAWGKVAGAMGVACSAAASHAADNARLVRHVFSAAKAALHIIFPQFSPSAGMGSLLQAPVGATRITRCRRSTSRKQKQPVRVRRPGHDAHERGVCHGTAALGCCMVWGGGGSS